MDRIRKRRCIEQANLTFAPGFLLSLAASLGPVRALGPNLLERTKILRRCLIFFSPSFTYFPDPVLRTPDVGFHELVELMYIGCIYRRLLPPIFFVVAVD
jgi:hypothetical protein